MVLARCEWGHDDYSLNIANLPMIQKEKQEPAVPTKPTRRNKTAANQSDLFGEEME